MLAEFWGWCRYIKVQSKKSLFCQQDRTSLYSFFQLSSLENSETNRVLNHRAKPCNYFYWTLFVAYCIDCNDIVILISLLLLITLKC